MTTSARAEAVLPSARTSPALRSITAERAALSRVRNRGFVRSTQKNRPPHLRKRAWRPPTVAGLDPEKERLAIQSVTAAGKPPPRPLKGAVADLLRNLAADVPRDLAPALAATLTQLEAPAHAISRPSPSLTAVPPPRGRQGPLRPDDGLGR